MFILIVAVGTVGFASRACLKRITCVIKCRKIIDYLSPICLKKEKYQVDDSPLDVHVDRATGAQDDTCYDVLCQCKKSADQFQPLLNNVVCHNLIGHPLGSFYATKEISGFDSKVAFDCLPLKECIIEPIDSSNILPSEILRKKPNSVRRKIYDYVRDCSDLSSNHSSITSGEFFEEDRESEK